MNTEKLIKNIIDQIKEAQIKLGFAKETTRLYYPVESLNAMLGIHTDNDEEMLKALGSSDLHDTELGQLHFSAHKGRIEISVPPEGAAYVHEHVEEPAFLKAMIELFRQNHHCSVADIRALFESFSKDYVCKKCRKALILTRFSILKTLPSTHITIVLKKRWVIPFITGLLKKIWKISGNSFSVVWREKHVLHDGN